MRSCCSREYYCPRLCGGSRSQGAIYAHAAGEAKGYHGLRRVRTVLPDFGILPVGPHAIADGAGELNMFGSRLRSFCCLDVTPSRRVLLSLFGVCLMQVAFPRVAAGQSEADRATARNLAAEGHTALRTQDCVTAEDRFRRADALVHAPTLVLEHARALICLKRFVEAQERLGLVMREGVSENAPWVWKKALQDAEKLLDEVTPKVGWITINVSGPTEPAVLVDGVQVPVAALGVRRAIDPGTRRISATAPGFVPKEVEVTMPEGGERAVTLELPADPSRARPIQSAPVKPKQPSTSHTETPKKPSRWPAYAAFGLGGAGMIVGTISGVVALGKRSDLKAIGCSGGRCPPGTDSPLQDQWLRYGTISGIGFGAAIVGTGVGVVLLLTGSGAAAKDEAKPAAKAVVLPYASLGEVGLSGAF